ncbi:hypothetical protein [Actinomadura sp. WMMA1423]|uniref:hypothetical protein n=1 Tax=Actinomadura sp. WMMA1423 TaxID=2591108 RepID=UPI0011469DA2|nr:hypothetical protein [Actinomadura sp. WMMA1423]
MSALVVWTAVWVLFWGVAVGQLWLPRRYFPWLVRAARASVVRALLLTAAVHLSGLLLFALAGLLINNLFAPDAPEWALAALFVVAGMLYSPLVGLALPARDLHPLEDVRLRLETAGATLGQERAIAWTACFLAFPGMSAIVGTAAVLLG